MRKQVLQAAGNSAVVDLDRGARLTSLVLDGQEVLGAARLPAAPPGILDGCFAMAPYAGRIKEGRLGWRGRQDQLPATYGGHAIHGTVYDAGWDETAPGASRVDLTEPWPFGGWVEQLVALEPDALRLQLVVGNDDREMPAWIGYHPWFRRRVGRGDAARVVVEAARRYARGQDGLPTGELVVAGSGPWDDCFTGPDLRARIVWPGWIELELRSSHNHVVVFDELDDLVCVEPQTGPPDAARLGLAAVVGPGRPLTLDVEFRLTRLG